MTLKLGKTTCDKCSKPLDDGTESVICVVEGSIEPVAIGFLTGQVRDFSPDDIGEVLFEPDEVRFACHASCWDGKEQ